MVLPRFDLLLSGQSGGNMVSYTYDAYGNTTVNTGSPLNNPYQYNAEYTDSSTGNQYLRARYYDPASGRFLTKDTYLGETNDPLSRNLYSYTKNNPVNSIDPSGHIGLLLGLGLGALLVGGMLLLSGCSKQNDSNESTKSESPNSEPKISYDEAISIIDDINNSKEEIEKIDDDLNNFIKGKQPVPNGKKMSALIDELNRKRKELCDSLETRSKELSEYNSYNPDNAVTIPELPNLESPYPSNKYKYIQAWQLEQFGWENVNDQMVASLNDILEKYNITDQTRIAHFMAQVAIESGYGHYTEEVDWHHDNYAHIEGGSLYRGAGYIQLSHDYNYREFADYIGDPEVINQGYSYVAKNYAWETAGWYWSVYANINNGINDSTTVKEVTRKVNGGYRELDKREEAYEKISRILNS